MNSRLTEKSKTFYNFLEAQIQLFKEQWMASQSTKDEEAIHQMRLAIKRIRTIKKLNKSLSTPVEIPENTFNVIKTIFSTSGQLRDLQIQSGLLSVYKKELKSTFSDLENYLSDKRTLTDSSIENSIPKADLVEEFSPSSDENEIPEFDSDIEVALIDFLLQKADKINQLIILLSYEEKVHELRKQLKQLFFIVQFMSEQLNDSVLYGYPVKNLKRISDNLGSWNDRDVFKQVIAGFLSSQFETYLENNPEYQILLYLIEYEKQKCLNDLDLDLYLELISLKSLFSQNIQNQTSARTS